MENESKFHDETEEMVSKMTQLFSKDKRLQSIKKETSEFPLLPKVRNLETNRTLQDKLCQKAKSGMCPVSHCTAALMETAVAESGREQHEVFEQAVDFLKQYYAQLKGSTPSELCNRLRQVSEQLITSGTIDYTYEELCFAAKTAWRNAARCIGRIQWNRLHLFDRRQITSTREMFDAVCEHIAYATNEGNIRSTITVFPQRRYGREDFRLWNSQLISFAGYQEEDGSILGDPVNVEFTKVCLRFGWNKPSEKRTRFDILPLVFSVPGESPTLYELPSELVLTVPIVHPTYEGVERLGLRWYALPAVSSMQFDCGGLQFTAAPFNGWYMSSEVGTRDLLDAARYDQLRPLANAYGLDTNAPSWQWKDHVAVETNIAVLHSYAKAGVTMVDPHSASDQFIQHMQNEYRLRGGCPADWVWITPPISGSLTKVFHQEMVNYRLKPSFEYQDKAWRTYRGGVRVQLRIHFRSAVQALRWTLRCARRMLDRRPTVRLLYASETGKSEEFAQRFSETMFGLMHCEPMRMDEYDLNQLSQESWLVVICSTFGSGQPPDNGQTFSDHLDRLIEQNQSLNKLRFCVFALGSSLYESFAAFGRSVDERLDKLKAIRIHPVRCADELAGQEPIYVEWSGKVQRTICEKLGLPQPNSKGQNLSLNVFETNQIRLVPADSNDVKQQDAVNDFKQISRALEKQHRKQLIQCNVISVHSSQPADYPKRTLLVSLRQEDTSVNSTTLPESESPSNKLNYLPGDHLGVFGENPPHLVDQLLNRLFLHSVSLQDESFSGNEVVLTEAGSSSKHDLNLKSTRLRTLSTSLHTSMRKLQLQKLQPGSGWINIDRVPPASLKTWFTHFVDICAPPSQRFLSSLRSFVEDSKDSQRLQKLISCNEDYAEWRTFHKPGLLDLFTHFPSLKISAEFLLMHLPLIQIRYYSISSSLERTKNEVHLTVTLAEHRTKEGKGERRFGLCSGFLASCKQEHPINCFVRPAPGFRLSTDNHRPVIMICAGSGIAPFRSFWMQRQYELENGRGPLGKMFLFFGCRQSKLDNIYGNDLPQLLNQGVLHDIFYAYSRDQQHKKRYVQDQVYKQRALLLWLLDSEQAHVYVCGSAAMASGVRNSFHRMLQSEKMLDEKQAQHHLHQLIENGRYHEDVFSSLHTYDIISG